jgi:hypothetical protein
MRGIVTAGVAAVLAMALVAGCTPSNPSGPSAPANDSGAASVSTAPITTGDGANPSVGMNELTGTGIWGITVTALEFATQAGGAKAEGGHELAVVGVRVSDNSTESAGLGPNAFKLVGPDGAEYQIAPTSSPAFIFNTPQPIKAHETRDIKLAYQVPAGVTQFKLIFAPFSPSGSTAPATVNVR